MNRKSLTLATILLATSLVQADSLCRSQLTYQAKEAMAAQMNADDDDIELVEYKDESSITRNANNRVSAVVTLIHRVYSGGGGPDTYANVRITARQIGNSPNCAQIGTAVTFAD